MKEKIKEIYTNCPHCRFLSDYHFRDITCTIINWLYEGRIQEADISGVFELVTEIFNNE